jgi:dTDP-4-amino-4,6-dideoxygalactose transaminase
VMKRRCSDLAILGGPVAFEEKLHVGRPNIGDREQLLSRLTDILDRRWLTNAGSYVQEFERRIAAEAGVKHCVATCNGAIALEIAVRALDLKGEVIVPAFTFVATAHALQWQRVTPVFADIDPRTHLIDPASVERLVTSRTTGIIGVHVWGQRCDVPALDRIAKRHGLRLLFDAAHALGCGTATRKVGSFGELEVFSFHATKFVNSLEGGAIVTNNDDIARQTRLMKNFGFLGYDNVGTVGTNGKMNEFSAAMGLTSLESMDEFVAINRRNHDLYRTELGGVRGIRLLRYDQSQGSNYQYVVAEVDESSPISRDLLLDVLWAENVIARRYFYPGCHRMEPYRSLDPDAARHLPATETVAARVLVLPTGQTMTSEHVSRVSSIIRVAVESGREISRQLARSERVHDDLLAAAAWQPRS